MKIIKHILQLFIAGESEFNFDFHENILCTKSAFKTPAFLVSVQYEIVIFQRGRTLT